MTITSSIARVSVLLSLVVPLIGCDSKLDSKATEVQLKDYAKEKGLTVTMIACPTEMSAKAGNVYKCTATDDQGTAGVLTVTTQDGGGVLMNVEGIVFFYKNFAEALMKGANTPGTTVDCTQKTVFAKTGLTIACTTVIPGQGPGKVSIVTTDDKGGYKLEGMPDPAPAAVADHPKE